MAILHLRRAKRRPRTAFVLGGGGNLGAIQVGMLRALLERGIVPELLVGCSVGAINAAGIAGDPSVAGASRLADVWTSLHDDVIAGGRLTSLKMLAGRSPSIQANDELRRLLETELPYTTFEEARVPLHVVATSLDTGHARWFSSGPMVEAVLASAALPGVFPPVEIDGELLIDGGVVDNVPLSRAVELGARRIFVLHVGNFDRKRPLPKRPIDVLVQSFSIARNHRFLRESLTPPEGVELVVLPSVDPGPIRYDDFRHSRRLIDQAHATAGAHLDQLHLRAAGD
ncbi:MAG TPA: patatin-like phospholipase family protein [Acidimicrobiales bacterium]|nr:patatin-like phospholipase family protein [Acidimicrobiales bacterium]